MENPITIIGRRKGGQRPSSQGCVKKQEFGHAGGGKLIHILTFRGRLIQFSHITRVKIEILLYKYSIFKHILNSSEYFVCFYLLFCTFYL